MDVNDILPFGHGSETNTLSANSKIVFFYYEVWLHLLSIYIYLLTFFLFYNYL